LAFALVLAAGLAIPAFLALMVLMSGSSGGMFSTDSTVLQEQHVAASKTGHNKIAIVRVEGAILDNDGFIKQQIDQVRRDDRVKGIVLRVDSPGGTVSASDYLYHHLQQVAKERGIPVVVSMGGICASGGYYIAMACGQREGVVFAEPTTWTGSIGVIIPHYNVAGLMEKWDIEEDSIKSHPLKALGSPTKKLTEQERAVLQGLVDDSFGRFKEIVQSGRARFAQDPEQLNVVATGQVFTAKQAVENGLVDKIGFVEEATARAIELAGIDVKDTQVVRYKREAGLMDLMLFGTNARAQASGGLDLQRIVDLATPRAYYMWSWLPQAEGIGR
jgi:protease-4